MSSLHLTVSGITDCYNSRSGQKQKSPTTNSAPYRRYLKTRDRQCRYNLKLRRVRETTVTVEKQYYIVLRVCVLMFVCVCVGGGAREIACVCARVTLLIQHETRRRVVIPGLSGSTTFFDIISNFTIFGKKLLNTKCVFWFSLQLSFETFFILGQIQRDNVINVKTPACKVPVIVIGLYWNLTLLDKFSKQSSNINIHQNTSSGSRVVRYGRT